MSAARDATVRARRMPKSRFATISSIRRASITFTPATPVSSAIRKASRSTTQLKASITIGRLGLMSGKNLKDYWKLEEHKLGDLTFTHFPDGTAHKNRMQGNDFVQSLMYARGVTSGIALLKCTSAYPAPAGNMNLRTLPHLRRGLCRASGAFQPYPRDHRGSDRGGCIGSLHHREAFHVIAAGARAGRRFT